LDGEGCLVNKVANNFIYPNKKMKIKIGDNVYRNFDSEFEKQILAPTKRKINIEVEIKDNFLKIIDEDGISVQKELCKGELPKDNAVFKNLLIKQLSKTGDSIFELKNISINQEVCFMPISTINQLRRELLDELVKKRVDYYEKNIKKVQNKMNYTKYFKDKVDYKANVYNKSAEEFYKKCGCEVVEKAFEYKKPNRKIELMTCKYCIKHALNMCKVNLKLYLVDEKGIKYPLSFDCKNCKMYVMSPD
jgi:putative protease